jgi:hypothetical protein
VWSMRFRVRQGSFINLRARSQNTESPVSKTVTAKERLLLNRHLRHRGLYVRVAKTMRVDASFVSKVASGTRTSRKIQRAVIAELKRIE